MKRTGADGGGEHVARRDEQLAPHGHAVRARLQRADQRRRY